MDYRERLRNIREDRNLTQAEIGKLLNKSQQGYNHIETGRAELKIEDLATLCRFYDLSADYIIGLVSKPASYKHK
jgi:transcriptional regulator with XRE-family HTH domain